MKSCRKSAPIISVLMPVYNREAYLAEAIESILGQTFGDLEFLILNSSSMEGVKRIIRDYAEKDRRIRPFSLGVDSHGYKMNFGVRQAAGKWLARMDSDDIAVPSRFQIQLEWMNATGVDICGSCFENFEDQENEVWAPESHEAVCRELLFRGAMLGGTVLMRSEILRNNPYREDLLIEDYEFLTRMTSKARLGNVPLVLLKYRRHAQQAIQKMAARVKDEFQKLRFQYFYARYPHTPLPDYLALARVADRQPMTNLSELRRAGRWLVDLARHPDPLLRKKMARRWRKTCERSQQLGEQGQTIFLDYWGQFKVNGKPGVEVSRLGTDRTAGPSYENIRI
jgi:glycosyltransferase involved in cell wall biosynthesis